MWAAIAMLCIGLVGFACWFFLVPNSHLSEHAQGFYLGAATGITAGALFLPAYHRTGQAKVFFQKGVHLDPRQLGGNGQLQPPAHSFLDSHRLVGHCSCWSVPSTSSPTPRPSGERKSKRASSSRLTAFWIATGWRTER